MISTYYFKFFLLYFLFLVGVNAHDCISFSQAKQFLAGFPTEPIKIIKENIALDEAYCAQEKLNYLIKKKHNDKIGYKVGFTGKALQDRFKINTPATGVLYKHMFLPNNSTIARDFGYRTFIEPDILVIVKDSKIMKATTKLEIIKNISSIHPFIEIPALRFKEGTKINGNMLIAANMLATKMIMAEGIKFSNDKEGVEKLSNLNTIFLDKDNNIIQNANTSNLMGNPLNVLKWLIEEFNTKGIALKKGDRISLGSVGKLFPLTKNTFKYYFEGYTDEKHVIKVTVN
ncbi:MAG: 2-keto-4-pentenoate hydratase [Alphaproteobacteria bacterium MarineAlpha9_Bin4]|nr:hypothetical protein [Pelagibacterales bacterium]PPR26354.1 MAG: 2-keto-4-pentenoate hydratase [Alphaproteobacteria bacterium MarineAlpha9_Bin4]|tara:strand:- start:323 stop:1183 length:861 start_codon:yes stop_codon:yes gene_type:complete